MTQHSLRGVRWLTALAVTIVLAGAARAGTDEVFDEDGDGVADEMDACSETPPGDLVDGDGCEVCPCEDAPDGDEWRSHRAYLACVKREIRSRRRTGIPGRREMRAAFQHAKRSTCGNPKLTRCCIFADEDAEVGRCRLLTWERCEHLEDTLDDAGDYDIGSCLPNPCE